MHTTFHKFEVDMIFWTNADLSGIEYNVFKFRLIIW